MANQLKSGERPAVAEADQNKNDKGNLSWPKDATRTALPPASLVQVRTLTIISSELPILNGSAPLVSEGGTYAVEELKECVRDNLLNLGYARATVEDRVFPASHWKPHS